MKLKLSPSIRIAVQISACLFLLACIGVNASCHQNDVVIYEVVGTVPSADIQLTNPAGGTDAYEDVGLPWRFSYGGYEDSYVYLYAHNNTDEGTITVNIYVNGTLFRTATSTGSYTTAVTYGDK